MVPTTNDIAAALVGDPVLWVLSNPESGAMIELGVRQPLARPVPNPNLTDEQREFEGAHSVFIQCAWDLRLPDTPEDLGPRSHASDSLELLDRLEGRRIEAASIDDANLLDITFDNGTTLYVIPRPARLGGGYTIRIDRFYWSVSEDGEIETHQE